LLVNRRENIRVTFQTEGSLDNTDWNILRELQQDSRLSYKELGRRIGLSAPAAAERVRKLEDRGVITGYGAQVDPAKVGLPILVFILLRCAAGKCMMNSSNPEEFPEVLEAHILSSDHCTLLKAAVSSINHLTALKERFEVYGSLQVNIVNSVAVSNQVIDCENPDVKVEPQIDHGWKKK
jgi:Lrp/AsnC family transcriptional regulator, leucine-responsive regulatory protein